MTMERDSICSLVVPSQSLILPLSAISHRSMFEHDVEQNSRYLNIGQPQLKDHHRFIERFFRKPTISYRAWYLNWMSNGFKFSWYANHMPEICFLTEHSQTHISGSSHFLLLLVLILIYWWSPIYIKWPFTVVVASGKKKMSKSDEGNNEFGLVRNRKSALFYFRRHHLGNQFAGKLESLRK